MFCEKCGTRVENEKFCPNCGNPIAQPVQAPQQPVQTPQQSGYTPGYPQPTYSQQPAVPYAAQYGAPLRGPAGGVVLEAIRKLASSRLFLIAAIAYTAAVVFSFVSSLSMGETLQDLMGELQINQAAGQLSANYNNTSSLGINVISILTAVGIWLCFFSASNREKPMSTAGLTILRVVETIGLVLLWIALVVVALLAVFSFLFSAQLGDVINEAIAEEAGAAIPNMGALSSGLLIGLVLLALAVIVLFVVYQTKLVQMIKTMRETVSTGVPSAKISGFVGGMCYVSAFFVGLSGLAMLAGGRYFGCIANVAGAAASVCFGMLIFKYRDTMQALTTPQNS